ncbi:hypothetical protein FE257_000186 [Aspergillus nanangensis]|uniref:MFS general substrate transporter n=1 Tax=Aspergillus nanangensis TaxID=2582783 RepID=A0AAD4CZF0_ASPNN|nr:hypothetical protein FE257_000186 [Aspergillus nanangensis]
MYSSTASDPAFIPGTVLLVDGWCPPSPLRPPPITSPLIQCLPDNHQQSIRHGSGKHTEIVLIPPPSQDPNDPLNWSPARKRLHLAILCTYTFVVNGLVNFYGVAYDGIAPDLHTTYDGLNTGQVRLPRLLHGAAFWQPVAMKMGHRPVYLLGCIVALIGSVIGAVQTNWGVWVTFNVLWGLGCGPKEGLPQISLQDTYFAHETGSRVGYWALSYSAGAFVVPLVAGYVYVDLSWRWCFWLTAIGFLTQHRQGIMTILLFFGLEETLYPRTYDATFNITPERDPPETRSTSMAPAIRMKCYWETHPLHSWGTNPHETWSDLFLRPFQLAQFPPILWAGLFTGISTCWWAAIFTTESQFFTGPPYHWTGQQVGLTNASALIGSLLGTIFAGNMGDWFVIQQAKRNHGIREPETRLILLAATAILTSGGLVMYGKGVEAGVHWTCPVVGMGLMAFGFTGSSIIGETYVLDSYRAVATESLVLINVCRNLIGMGFVFGVQPWLVAEGYGNAYFQMMAMGLIAHGTVVPMMVWGKQMRGWTARRYLEMVEQRGMPREFA